jgi:membrane associated rhomboid family serine protease
MRTTLWDDFKMYVLNSGNALNKLLAINIAVFLLFGIIYIIDKLFLINMNLEDLIKRGYLGFPAVPVAFLHKPWTIITYQFVHEGFFHVLFNMMMLLVAGRIFREFLGDKKLVTVYLLGGAAGAIMFMLAMNAFPLFKDINPNVIGASASVIAILAAAATLVPNYTLFLVFIGPVRLIYIMLFFFLVDLLSVAGPNGGGHFSHLGGAIFGFVYIKALQNGTDIGAWLSRFMDWAEGLFQRKKQNIRVSYRSPQSSRPMKKKVSQDEIDAILDKIAKSGYDSLSQGEKDILFRASKDN